MSSKSYILGQKPKTKIIERDGQKIELKAMTAAQRRDWRKLAAESQDEDTYAITAVYSIYENGEQVFTDDDIEKLTKEVDFSLLEEIFDAAVELNNISNNAVEDAEKN